MNARTGPVGLALLALALSGVDSRPEPPGVQPPTPRADHDTARRAAPKPRPSPPPVFEGFVRGPDGKPIEGARVTWRAEAGPGAGLPMTATTDAAGRFRIDLPGAGRLTVRVDAKGYAGRVFDSVKPGAPLAVTLDRGRPLEGTIRDAAGQPLPDARVIARAESSLWLPWDPQSGSVTTTSDARGRYRLEGLEAALLTLSASATGSGHATKHNVRAGGRVDLVLAPGAGISGSVRDPEGRPVQGALARAEMVPFGGGDTAATDIEGRFELGGLGAGTYAVVVRHADFAPALQPDLVVAGESPTDTSIALEPGAEVIGRLIDAEERPIAGSLVLSRWGDHQAPLALIEVLRADARNDGRFRLPRLGAGRYVFDASSPGLGRRAVEVAASGREAVVDVGDIVIEAGLAIRGLVRTRAGQAVADAKVTASEEQSFFSGFSPIETQSQGDGTFLIGGLTPGPYHLSASAPGYTRGQGQAAAGAADVELLLDTAGTVTGLVVEEGDRPVEGFRVQVQPMGGSQRSQRTGERSKTVASPDGRFVVEDLAPGDYVLRVIVPERAPATVSGVKVTEALTTDAGTIRVPRGGMVRGLVVDGEGGMVAGASVTVSMGEMDMVSWMGLLSDQSNASGAFEVRGVPAGSARVRATHPSYAAGSATVEVDPAKGPAETRIVLRQGGLIEGVARRRDGQPLPGQTIWVGLADQRGLDIPFPTTGADGSFRLEHVPPGRATVTLMASTGLGQFVNAVSREVDVLEGQTTNVELVSRDVLVAGRVTRSRALAGGVDLDLQAVNGMSMALAGGYGSSAAPSDGPKRNQATTREDGSFEMVVSEPGRYHVTAQTATPRMALPVRTIEIPDVESHTLELDYSGVPVAGVVVARETEEPIDRAYVGVQRQNASGGSDDEGWSSGTSGPDGRFEFLAAPGAYRLSAGAEGRARFQQELSIGESGISDLRIELARGLEITGRVVNSAGQGLAGVQVMALGNRGKERSRSGARTRGDGSFTLASLLDLPHNLATGSELAGFALRSSVRPGAKDVTLSLQPGARARVLILDGQGAPVAQAFPMVERVNGAEYSVPVYAGRPTDAAGRTEIPVPAAEVSLRFQNEKASGRATFTVAAGETVEVELRLTDPPDRR